MQKVEKVNNLIDQIPDKYHCLRKCVIAYIFSSFCMKYKL